MCFTSYLLKQAWFGSGSNNGTWYDIVNCFIYDIQIRMKEKTLREFLETYFELDRKDTELNQCLIRNLTDVLT